MNKLLISLLFIVSVFLVACNSSIDTELNNKSAKATNNYFFPDLLQQLDEVDHIVVSRAGTKVIVSLSRNDEGWHLDKPASVPANPYLLEEILKAMAIAKVLEIKTTEADWYQHLGVEGIQLAASTGTMIEFKSPSQSWRVIVGKQSDTQKGQYWRQPEQAAVVRVDQALALPEDLLSWMDRLIIDLPASGVAAIEIKNAAGSKYHLERTHNQVELSISSKQIDSSLSQKLLRGLYKLHYDQIRISTGSLGQDVGYQLQYSLFDGNRLTLTCSLDAEGSWCQLRVMTDGNGIISTDSAKLLVVMNERLSKWDFHLSVGRTELFVNAIKILENSKNE